jgi:hypothetical protein
MRRRENGWLSEPLEAYVDELTAASLPPVFEFAALMARDEDRGVVCVPWFRTQPGLTEIGVRIQGIGEPCNVTLMHSSHPIYLEDDFPLAATRIKGSNLLFLDKKRITIASVDLSGATHNRETSVRIDGFERVRAVETARRLNYVAAASGPVPPHAP